MPSFARYAPLVSVFMLLLLGGSPTGLTNAQDDSKDFFSTGNKLLSLCDDPDVTKHAVCVAYLSGFTSGYETSRGWVAERVTAAQAKDRAALATVFAEAGPELCVPAGVSRGQVTDIVVLYLKNHPATRHLPSEFLIVQAVSEAFPCK
jgi:hypothetical protein